MKQEVLMIVQWVHIVLAWSERFAYLSKVRVDDVRTKIEGELNALHAALERRKQIGAAREKLELMQDAVHLEGKVKSYPSAVIPDLVKKC